MPKLGVLFTPDQLNDPVAPRAAYRAMLALVDVRWLAGCTFHHGQIDRLGQFCVAVQGADHNALGRIRHALAAGGLRVFPPPTQGLLDDTAMREDGLQVAARVDSAGQLVDVRQPWLPDVWRQAQARMRPAPPPVGGETLGVQAPPQYAQYPPPPPRPPERPVYAPEPATLQTSAPVRAVREPMAYPPPPSVERDAGGLDSLRAHPAFPRAVSRALTEPASGNRIAALVGIVAGLAAGVILFLASPRGTLLFEMFDLRKPATVVPVAVLVMFFWGIAVCAFRWRRLREMEQISGRPLLLASLPLLDDNGVRGLQGDLEAASIDASPLLRRMKAVLHQWGMRPSLQDADVVLQQLAATDDESVHAGYSLVRTFVWALPVIGLIGTVIGIALAVGGFAKFLGGNIDDVAVIKQNLVSVTGGLSFAFLITLEGLLTSLVLMLAASPLQTREQDLYTRVQQDIADLLIPALQGIAPESVITRGTTHDKFPARDQLTLQVANVTMELQSVGERLLKSMEARHQEWVAQLGRTGLEIVASIRHITDDRASAAAAQQQLMAERLAEQAEATARAATTLESLNDTTRMVVDHQLGLHSAIQAVTTSDLGAVLKSYSMALESSAGQIQSVIQAADNLARLTHEVIAAQAALEANRARLADSEFVGALAGLKDSLERLAPVLASFQRPFVLQAVPVAGERGVV
jgi:biopolymer transport protein ExbB/TolQ